MADVKAVVLEEGARVKVQVTVYEDVEKGRVFKKGDLMFAGKPVKVQTRAEGGARYVNRIYVYPFPAGMAEDPWTERPARQMNVGEIAKAIEAWQTKLAELAAAGGRVTTTIPGTNGGPAITINSTCELDCIPTIAQVFEKGFKLQIQGPMNQELAKQVLAPTAGSPKAKKIKSDSPENFA